MIWILQPHARSSCHRDPGCKGLHFTEPCVLWVLPAWLCVFQQELGILGEFTTFCPSSTNKTAGLLSNVLNR